VVNHASGNASAAAPAIRRTQSTRERAVRGEAHSPQPNAARNFSKAKKNLTGIAISTSRSPPALS
jgi:hypothetical protein